MTKTAGRRRADSPRPPEYDLPTREPRIESPRTARLLMFGALNWSAQWYRADAGVSIDGAPGVVTGPSLGRGHDGARVDGEFVNRRRLLASATLAGDRAG